MVDQSQHTLRVVAPWQLQVAPLLALTPSHLLCSWVTFTLQDDLVASLRKKGVVRSKKHSCYEPVCYVCKIQGLQSCC